MPHAEVSRGTVSAWSHDVIPNDPDARIPRLRRPGDFDAIGGRRIQHDHQFPSRVRLGTNTIDRFLEEIRRGPVHGDNDRNTGDDVRCGHAVGLSRELRSSDDNDSSSAIRHQSRCA